MEDKIDMKATRGLAEKVVSLSADLGLQIRVSKYIASEENNFPYLSQEHANELLDIQQRLERMGRILKLY